MKATGAWIQTKFYIKMPKFFVLNKTENNSKPKHVGLQKETEVLRV